MTIQQYSLLPLWNPFPLQHLLTHSALVLTAALQKVVQRSNEVLAVLFYPFSFAFPCSVSGYFEIPFVMFLESMFWVVPRSALLRFFWA